MSRLKLVMLSMFAVLAVSAAASASAFGVEVECTTGATAEKGGDVALCIGKKEVGSPSEHAPVPFTSKKVAATVSELKVEAGPNIVCKKAENTGQFDVGNGNIKEGLPNPEISDLYIEFTECEVTNTAATKANCEVKEPIVVSGGPNESKTLDDGLNGFFTGEITTAVLFEPSQETEVSPGVFRKLFTKITIKTRAGKPACTLAVAGAEVTGTQTAKIIAPEAETITHEIAAEFSGSTLKFAGKKAEFKVNEEVELNSKEAYGIFKS
jgi:hypothetical protein